MTLSTGMHVCLKKKMVLACQLAILCIEEKSLKMVLMVGTRDAEKLCGVGYLALNLFWFSPYCFKVFKVDISCMHIDIENNL